MGMSVGQDHTVPLKIYTDQDKEAWVCPLEADSFYSHFTLHCGVHFFLYCFKLKSLYIGPSFLLGTKLHCTVV